MVSGRGIWMTSAVHPATADDADICAAIVNDWIDATDWHPRVHTHADVARFYREVVWAKREVLVAGTPATGFIAMTEDHCVTALYAATPGRGTGTALMQAGQAARPELSLWTHVPNTPAQSFYRKMGFDEVRRTDGDNEEGVPDILYRWVRT